MNINRLVVCFIGFICWFACVPIKKQLLLTDKNKKTLREKQQMDTVVTALPFEYKVKKGDILGVSFTNMTPGDYRLDQATRSGGEVEGSEQGYVVNDSGIVDLPVVGPIKVGGLNLEKTREKIRNAAFDYINNVTVSIKLLSFEVTILGEIGARTIRSTDGRLTIIDAISNAGGATAYANLERVKIIRQSEIADKVHIFYVDVSDVSLINKKEYFLMPNDIIVLEPRRAKNVENFRTLLTLGTSVLSALILVYTLVVTLQK